MTFAHRRRTLTSLAVTLAAACLAGCMDDRVTTGSLYPIAAQERHPIVLTNGPRTLDLFPIGFGGLDAREYADLRAFVAEYRRYGSGPLLVQVPSGGPAREVQHALGLVRQAAGGRVTVQSYVPADPSIASPIRLGFRRLEAKVGTPCGLWPNDLGVSDRDFALRNDPYWNHGCAFQSNLAQQVADPVDLVRGRQDSAPDTVRRMYNIDQLRRGQDPSTVYRQDGQNKINQTVGN